MTPKTDYESTWHPAEHAPALRIWPLAFLYPTCQRAYCNLTRTSSFAVSSFSILDITSSLTRSTCSWFLLISSSSQPFSLNIHSSKRSFQLMPASQREPWKRKEIHSHLGAEGTVRITQLIQFMSMFILVLAHFLIFSLVRVEHERCSTISTVPSRRFRGFTFGFRRRPSQIRSLSNSHRPANLGP